MTPADHECAPPCFDCRYWLERIQWAEDGDQMPPMGQHDGAPIARVNGRHYVVEPYDTTTPSQWRGSSGAEFTFRFHDGREITSNDVWTQGEIPARFRDRLPDNAVIVPQEAAR